MRDLIQVMILVNGVLDFIEVSYIYHTLIILGLVMVFHGYTNLVQNLILFFRNILAQTIIMLVIVVGFIHQEDHIAIFL